VCQNAIDEGPAKFAQLFFALRIPAKVLPLFADGHVRVHAVAVHADNGLRQKARSQPHLGGHLAADQFVELNLVRRGHHFSVAVIDLELRGRNFRVILLVLKTHRALHFRGGVDKRAQRIARKRVIISAGIDIFKLAGFVVAGLRVHAVEQKALDLVRSVERVTFLLVQFIGKSF
jgi:hypothetical protein